MSAMRAEKRNGIPGLEVRRVKDVQTGTTLDLATGEEEKIDLPESNVLPYELDGDD